MRADGQTDVTELKVSFRNFANACEQLVFGLVGEENWWASPVEFDIFLTVHTDTSSNSIELISCRWNCTCALGQYISHHLQNPNVYCPYISPLDLFLDKWHPVHPLSYRPITAWCRVLLEKLTGLQLVKKFHAFHGTRMFITALTSVRHLFLYWAGPIQSIYPHPTSWTSILILSTHLRLGLPSGLYPSGFSTKTLYTPHSH